MARPLVVAAVGLALLAVGAGTVAADDGWNPFKAKDEARARASNPSPATEPREPLPPMGGIETAPWGPRRASPDFGRPTDNAMTGSDEPASWSQTPDGFHRPPPAGAPSDSVQRADLRPVAAPDGSGLPQDLWSGLDTRELQELITPLSIPPRSAALADLWRRLWTSEDFAAPGASSASAGATGQTSLAAVRIEALYRSGLVGDLAKALSKPGSRQADATTDILLTRARILLVDRSAGCSEVKGLQRAHSALPKPARHEFMVLAALCGAAGRDPGAAGLAADLLRAEGIEAPIPFAALDAIASGTIGAAKLPAARSIGLLDYRFLELAGAERLPGLATSAEPALLAVLAASGSDVATRIAAAEAGLTLHALTPADLAAAYRAAPNTPQASAEPPADRLGSPARRAALFKAFEADRSPIGKARQARALLDEARRARGAYMQIAAMLAPGLEAVQPAPEIGWFAETAIEVMLAAGRYDVARRWAEAPLNDRYGGHRHWLALIDIADVTRRGNRGDDLSVIEQFAIRGRLAPELMHRLVTVLDALDYQIPIPLWEAASRSPQPSSGYLPDTGVLSQLQQASKQKIFARVVLMAMRTMGPDSGETAHIIALGDVVRALKVAGLEPSARRLGLEALFASWPRSAHN